MKRLSMLCAPVVLGLACGLAVSALAAPGGMRGGGRGMSLPHPAPQPGPGKGQPDLVVTSFGVSAWGKCAPGEAVVTFTATVKNRGTASWTGVSDLAVRDLKAPGQWFSSVPVDPLAPGQSRLITVPLYYLSGNPGFMASGSPHPFQARVNETHHPNESDFGNNAGDGPALYNGKRVVNVTVPKDCGGKP